MTKDNGDRHPSTLKKRAIEELLVYWTIALYLALFLGAFANYRRLVVAEFGVVYLNYGVAIIEALVLAKVIMIGDWLGIGRRFERGPLVLSAAYKSAAFSLLVILFGIAERMVEGLIHGLGWSAIAARFAEVGGREILARLIMMIAAFLPFFAFWEIRRVVGHQRFALMLFSRQAGMPPAPGTPGGVLK